jgi:hypothetical protein
LRGKEIEDLTLEAETFARDVVALGAVWVYAERTAVAGYALHPRVAPEVLLALVAPPPSKSGPAHVFFIEKERVDFLPKFCKYLEVRTTVFTHQLGIFIKESLGPDQ